MTPEIKELPKLRQRIKKTFDSLADKLQKTETTLSEKIEDLRRSRQQLLSLGVDYGKLSAKPQKIGKDKTKVARYERVFYSTEAKRLMKTIGIELNQDYVYLGNDPEKINQKKLEIARGEEVRAIDAELEALGHTGWQIKYGIDAIVTDLQELDRQLKTAIEENRKRGKRNG